MTAEQIAARGTILRTTVGSVAHGLNIGEQADRDEMGVCIEPPEYVIGHGHFEQYTQRTRPEGERSQPGDLDLVVYSLRKWMRLAMSGNPTVILLLFVPEEFWITSTPVAREMQKLAPLIVSQRAGRACLGYMTQQRQRLTGEAGQKGVQRPELVERYGFDTKYAMHVLRLGMQGIELMTRGRMTLPMVEADRQVLRDVRTGGWTYEMVLARAQELEDELESLVAKPRVAREPDRAALDAWLVRTYQAQWGKR
jgi:predicted nucleotidyltransferase